MAEAKKKPTSRKKPPQRLYINVGLDKKTHALVAEAAEAEMRNLNQQAALWLTGAANTWDQRRQEIEDFLAHKAAEAEANDDWVEVDLDELDASVPPGEGSSEP